MMTNMLKTTTILLLPLLLLLLLQVNAFVPHRQIQHASRTALSERANIPGPPYSGPSVKPILDSVNYPSDMKRLDMRQLKQVRC